MVDRIQFGCLIYIDGVEDGYGMALDRRDNGVFSVDLKKCFGLCTRFRGFARLQLRS